MSIIAIVPGWLIWDNITASWFRDRFGVSKQANREFPQPVAINHPLVM